MGQTALQNIFLFATDLNTDKIVASYRNIFRYHGQIFGHGIIYEDTPTRHHVGIVFIGRLAYGLTFLHKRRLFSGYRPRSIRIRRELTIGIYRNFNEIRTAISPELNPDTVHFSPKVVIRFFCPLFTVVCFPKSNILRFRRPKSYLFQRIVLEQS